MTPDATLFLAKFTLISGLAAWLTLIAINNVIAFRGGAISVGVIMNMDLLEQAPRISTPLLSRRVANAFWHSAVYGFIVALEGIAALLLLFAAAAHASVLLAGGSVAGAAALANVALIALLGLSFIMLIGGGWFAYYIRQEGSQITHFALITVTLLSVVLINLPGA